MARHALVVGGTGMLREVSLTLAERGHPVSVVARNRRRLRSLADEAERRGGAVYCIPVDYRDGDALTAALRDAVAAHGPLELAVVWIHSIAPEAPLQVARATVAASCRFFHLLGSAAADPSAPDTGRRERFESIPGLSYHEVVLGFVLEGRRSRWLTNDEIAAGVLAAIDSAAARSVVGAVEPWSARP